MFTKSLKNHGNKNVRNPSEPDVADIQYLDIKSKQSPSKSEKRIIDGYYFSDAKRKIAGNICIQPIFYSVPKLM
ncbi:hypothetical protein AHF37_12163 [Paragonimus kellicotti]|nr:hypothetical protein AHF37_12163 [Paragonimus kellicotti]